MKKKILALALVTALGAGLFTACNAKDTTTTTASEASKSQASVSEASKSEGGKESSGGAQESKKPLEGDHLVYLITMDLNDQHWASVDAGAKKAAEELGLKYKWTAPTTGKNDAAQIENINNAVADNASVIMLASNGPSTQVSALEEAAAAGVKIIYVDSPADFPALQTLATDNKAAGKTAGAEMIKSLEAKGIKDGKIGIVNINSSTMSTVLREEGFRSAFEGTAYEILATQYGEGQVDKSQQIATNYITEGCVGIFGANEGSTVGTGNAIKEDGNEVVGIGFDKSDAILQLIKDGSLLGTMSQNPYDMGYQGIQSAYKALNGETISPAFVDTGVSVITKDNVAEFSK